MRTYNSVDWSKAKCLGANPKAFYQDPKYTRRIEKIKKKYCRKCPIKRDCLEYATDNEELGIWGGLTEDERVLSGVFRLMFPKPLLHVSVQKVEVRVSYSLANTPHERQHPSDEHSSSQVYMHDPYIHTQQALSPLAATLAVFQASQQITHTPQFPEPLEYYPNQTNLSGHHLVEFSSPLQPSVQIQISDSSKANDETGLAHLLCLLPRV